MITFDLYIYYTIIIIIIIIIIIYYYYYYYYDYLRLYDAKENALGEHQEIH